MYHVVDGYSRRCVFFTLSDHVRIMCDIHIVHLVTFPLLILSLSSFSDILQHSSMPFCMLLQ